LVEGAASHTKADFEYGWCYTDHKDGLEIRKDFRKIDFFQDEPYAKCVAAMLDQIGLPMPEKAQIFRGTHHDLLFLDSHGVVIRIGPLDVEDLMNPGILQPLGWLESPDNNVKIDALRALTAPLTVAIYPGIELFKNYLDDNKRPKSAGELKDFMELTGAGLGDVSERNKGVIRLQDEAGSEVAVEMLLDPDNNFNESSQESSVQRSSIFEQAKKKYKSKGDILLYSLTESFKEAKNISYWQRAFQLHQPLRNLFWQAFDNVKGPDDKPDLEKLEAFWNKCAAATVKPEQQKMYVWHTKTNIFGVQKLVRKEAKMPELVLYTPWAQKHEDQSSRPSAKGTIKRKAIKYINQPDNIKEAVKKACRKHFMPKKDIVPCVSRNKL
jgi:hypothetical protein